MLGFIFIFLTTDADSGLSLCLCLTSCIGVTGNPILGTHLLSGGCLLFLPPASWDFARLSSFLGLLVGVFWKLKGETSEVV